MLIRMLTKTQIKKIKMGTAINSNDQFSLIFEALGDLGRLRIFKLLATHNDICVTDVAKILGITTSAASQQLRIIERVGLVQKIRMGQMVCYKIKYDLITRHIIQLLKVEQ